MSGCSLTKRARSEKVLLITAPIRASEISAEVELTPPTSDGAEVQETVTHSNIVDIQRYLRWADQAMDSHRAKERRKVHAAPKAA